MTRIALATSAALPHGDPDDARLPAVLGAEWRIWDDPDVDWAAYDLVVVRSVWDYFDRLEEFLAWADRVPRLANPAPVLRWNTDKRYLADLAAEGIAVVPTTFVAPGEGPPTLAGELVVKPVVSGGARDTARHADPQAARAHVERMIASGQVAMVQPYVHGVDETGETGLLFFGGRFSHAFRKGALLERDAPPRADAEMAEDIGPREPTAAERAVAERVLAAAERRFGTLLYVRVDLLPTADGPVLVELEATEPSLWFQTTEGGEERFAEAVNDLL